MADRAQTPSQTVGPYLSLGMPWTEGSVADPDGVRVSGLVLDGAGEPIPDALIEAWYHDPPAYARSLTDDGGAWELVVPPVPFLAAHIFARGLLRHLTFRIYLNEPAADDPALVHVAGDRRHTLIARRTQDGYRFDVRLQGDGETVFFDV